MKISIFAYTKKGCETAISIADALRGENSVSCFTVERFLEEEEIKNRFSLIEKKDSFYGEKFSDSDALIFVGATGIAVRNIAPYIEDKMTDPAVISVDEKGDYIIPILGGHVGGANALARKIADELGGESVVTTATDINKKFSVDTWAVSQGLVIASREAAKEISAEILERDVLLKSDLPIKGELPSGVKAASAVATAAYNVEPGAASNASSNAEPGAASNAGIYIGWKKEEPFKKTLRLIPCILHLGIGCRRDTGAEKIRAFVEKVLEEESIDKRAIKGVASIDIKSNEEGLLAFASEEGVPINFYSAEELAALSGDFSSSTFVEGVTGVDNVCERAAVMDTMRGSVKRAMSSAEQTTEKESSSDESLLIVRKTAADGVTLAIAAEYMEVSLE